MTLSSAFALLVAGMVGTGVFTSTALVNKHVPPPGAALLVWAVSGLIARIGATSFAELGAAIPKNGGMQEHLGDIYGPYVASVLLSTSITLVKPAVMAILSLVISEYWITIILASEIDS